MFFINKINLKLVLIFACIFIVSIKIALLPLTSFPYDFATYVYQIRQYYDFGIHPLFFWNKGAFLHGIFFGCYLIYDYFSNILSFDENILLLHFFYKLPLLIFDLGVGFVIWKCSIIFNLSKQTKYLLFLLWLTSPIVLWTTEIEGKYAIIASFFSIFSYYLYISNKKVLSLVPLAISASIYYYAFILFPIYLFFYLREKRKGLFSLTSFKFSSVFSISILVLFLPFIIWFSYLIPLTTSLIYHTQPDAPIDVTEIEIPDYSFFKMPFYVVKNYFPTNIASPEYFSLVSKITLLAFVFTFVYLTYLYFRINNKKIIYSPEVFLKCNLIILLIFIIFIGKFQAHYLIWVLPYIVLFLARQKKYFIYLYLIIALFPLINTLGRLNLGIYFLDSVPWGVVDFWLNFSDVINALIGSIVFITLLGILTIVLHDRSATSNKIFSNLSIVVVITISILTNLLFIIPTFNSYQYLKYNYDPTRELASDNRVLRFGFSKISFDYVDYKQNEQFLVKTDFNQVSSKTNDDIILSFVKPWDIFVSKGGTAYIENLAEKSLVLNVTKNNAFAQLNMGSNNSDNLIPVDYNKEYLLSVIAKSEKNDGGRTSISIRFADWNKKIISGSDVIIANSINPNNWTEYNKTIRPDNITYKYIEIVATAEEDSNVQSILGNILFIKSINLKEKDIPKHLKYTLHGKSNIEIIQSEILDKPEIRKLFDIVVEISSIKHYFVKSINLNGCEPGYINNNTEGAMKHYSYYFSVNCAEYDKDSTLFIEYFDVPIIADIQIAILKK